MIREPLHTDSSGGPTWRADDKRHAALDLDRAIEDGSDAALVAWVRRYGRNLHWLLMGHE
jgi:hypothetical protein